MHIEESITLATSITKQKTNCLCILKPANVSPFRVIIVSSISGLFLVFGCLILLCITLCTLKNEEKSTNVIVSNPSGNKILFSTFCTDVFTFWEKNWGGHARPPSGLSSCYRTDIGKFCNYQTEHNISNGLLLRVHVMVTS